MDALVALGLRVGARSDDGAVEGLFVVLVHRATTLLICMHAARVQAPVL